MYLFDHIDSSRKQSLLSILTLLGYYSMQDPDNSNISYDIIGILVELREIATSRLDFKVSNDEI